MPEDSDDKYLPAEETQVDLKTLVPLAEQWIENSHAEAKDRHELEREKLRIEEKWQDSEASTFKYKFWLILLIAVSILGISAGLIFVVEDVDAGLLMLSHIGAVVAGAIAGSGWERLKKED